MSDDDDDVQVFVPFAETQWHLLSTLFIAAAISEKKSYSENAEIEL